MVTNEQQRVIASFKCAGCSCPAEQLYESRCPRETKHARAGSREQMQRNQCARSSIVPAQCQTLQAKPNAPLSSTITSDWAQTIGPLPCLPAMTPQGRGCGGGGRGGGSLENKWGSGQGGKGCKHLVHVLDVDAAVSGPVFQNDLLQVEEGSLMFYVLPHLLPLPHTTVASPPLSLSKTALTTGPPQN